MKERTYEMNQDYILEVLEEAEDKLFQELYNNLPIDSKFILSKLVAVKDEKEKINLQIVLNQKNRSILI